MKILMTNHALDARAGSESYLETVAAELRRLGHVVTFYSPSCGAFAVRLREDGFDVHDDATDLPADVDVIHGQHVDAVAQARTRLPRAPLVFASHSWFVHALEDPVAELGAAAYLAFNDHTHQRLTASVVTQGAPVVRLRQPVEITHGDAARVTIAAAAQRAVAVSRRMKTLPTRLAKACADLGIAFEWVGGPGRVSADARREIFAADIVVAMGRTALEAMAAGRAVLVADETTMGGWVTNESYPALEADGFTGLGSSSTHDDLEEILAGYGQDLGVAARQLAVQHHPAQLHAVRLLEVYEAAAGTSRNAHAPETVALLASDRNAWEHRALRAEWASAQAHREIAEGRAELVRARDSLASARAELDGLRSAAEVLDAELDRVRRRRDRLREQRDRLRRQRRRLVAQRDEARRTRFARARAAGRRWWTTVAASGRR